MLDDSFDESSVRQMAGLERSLSSSVAGNIGHRTSGQDIYQLTYQSGKLTLQDLHIGARVVDLSWEWEFRAGNNYTGSGEKKPVVWILVAKNHYSGLSSHATLLAEELIGKFTFDNSKRLLSLEAGVNRWGESGKKDASLGLRPWLNSKSTHSGQGFYIGFSANFKRAVLTTTLLNREWEKGGVYSASDYVFLPSTTELGDTLQRYTYQIGTVYPYFEGSDNARRAAQLNGEVWCGRVLLILLMAPMSVVSYMLAHYTATSLG